MHPGSWALRIDRHAINFGLRFSALCFVTVAPCFGQVAKQFVKVEPNQCWLDVKDAVHRRAYGVITDERLHTLTIDRFASVEGTIAIIVEVVADQNKKGHNADFYSRFAGLNTVAVICRLEPCAALRRRSCSRANLREDFVGAEFGASRERHHFFPVGTFCFSSSNQFSTTLICVGAACSSSLTITIC